MKFQHYIAKGIVIGTLLFSGLIYADPVWIDVRSAQEYQAEHINGDIRISYTQIVQEVEQAFPDKTTPIRLYCRSGRRAGIALSSLESAGYSNVENVGSIGRVKALRNK